MSEVIQKSMEDYILSESRSKSKNTAPPAKIRVLLLLFRAVFPDTPAASSLHCA